MATENSDDEAQLGMAWPLPTSRQGISPTDPSAVREFPLATYQPSPDYHPQQQRLMITSPVEHKPKTTPIMEILEPLGWTLLFMLIGGALYMVGLPDSLVFLIVLLIILGPVIYRGISKRSEGETEEGWEP